MSSPSFTGVLLTELLMIALLRQVADPGDTEGDHWAGGHVHSIRDTPMVELGWSSELDGGRVHGGAAR